MRRTACASLGASLLVGSLLSAIPTFLLGIHSYYGTVGLGAVGIGLLIAAGLMRGAR